VCLTPFCLKQADTHIQLPLIPEECPTHRRRQPPHLWWKLGQPMGGRQGTAATQTRVHFRRVVSTGSWEAGGRDIHMVFKLQRETK